MNQQVLEKESKWPIKYKKIVQGNVNENISETPHHKNCYPYFAFVPFFFRCFKCIFTLKKIEGLTMLNVRKTGISFTVGGTMT